MHRTAYDTASDLELVRLVQKGDMQAFEVIYARHYPQVFRVILRKTLPNRELAEDIASDAFVKAFQSIHTFTELKQGGLPAWLTTIARNRLNDHWKSPAARNSVLLDAEQWDYVHSSSQRSDPAPAAEDVAVGGMMEAADATRLRQALAQLTELQRACLILRFFNEKSVSETAKILGRSEGGVKVLQHKALRRLSGLTARHV